MGKLGDLPPRSVVIRTIVVVLFCLAAHVGFVYLALMINHDSGLACLGYEDALTTTSATDSTSGAQTTNSATDKKTETDYDYIESLLCQKSWRLWFVLYLWIPGIVTVAASFALGSAMLNGWEVVKASAMALLSTGKRVVQGLFQIFSKPEERDAAASKSSSEITLPIDHNSLSSQHTYWWRVVIFAGILIGVGISFWAMALMNTILSEMPDPTDLNPRAWPYYFLLRLGLPALPLLLLLITLVWERKHQTDYKKELRYWMQKPRSKTIVLSDRNNGRIVQSVGVGREADGNTLIFLLAFRYATSPGTTELEELSWDRKKDDLSEGKFRAQSIIQESISKVVVTTDHYALLGQGHLYVISRKEVNEQFLQIATPGFTGMCVLDLTGDLIFSGQGSGLNLFRGKIHEMEGNQENPFKSIQNGLRSNDGYHIIWHCVHSGHFFGLFPHTSNGKVLLQRQQWGEIKGDGALSDGKYKDSNATERADFGDIIDLATRRLSSGGVEAIVLHYKKNRHLLTGFLDNRYGKRSFEVELKVKGTCRSICVDQENRIWIWGDDDQQIWAHRISDLRLQWARWLH